MLWFNYEPFLDSRPLRPLLSCNHHLKCRTQLLLTNFLGCLKSWSMSLSTIFRTIPLLLRSLFHGKPSMDGTCAEERFSQTQRFGVSDDPRGNLHKFRDLLRISPHLGAFVKDIELCADGLVGIRSLFRFHTSSLRPCRCSRARYPRLSPLGQASR